MLSLQLLPSVANLLFTAPHGTSGSGCTQRGNSNQDNLFSLSMPMLSYEQHMDHAHNSMNNTPSPESTFSQDYSGCQINAMDNNTTSSELHHSQLTNDQV